MLNLTNFLKFRQIFSAAVVLTALITTGCKKGGDPAPEPQPGPEITLPTQAVNNTQNLKQWNAWKTAGGSRFDWMLIGDSYTQGNFYSQKLRAKVLADGYLDGGAGYCSFHRYGDYYYAKDGSIDSTELNFYYDFKQWDHQDRNSIGPNGFVTSKVANAAISLISSKALNTITLIYERHASAGSFRYRVNAGAWTTVNDNSTTPDIANTVIDVSTAGSNITVDIETLNAGIKFCGALEKKAGNVFTMHKCGSSGSPSYMFGANDLWSQSTQLLTPKGVIIEFGINELLEGLSPADMKSSIQNIITRVRTISPNCDIILISAPQTTYEKEQPKAYKISDYAKILWQLSNENNTAFIDLNIAFGPFSQASVDSGLMGADRTHPGTKGGDLIASTIYNALKK